MNEKSELYLSVSEDEPENDHGKVQKRLSKEDEQYESVMNTSVALSNDGGSMKGSHSDIPVFLNLGYALVDSLSNVCRMPGTSGPMCLLLRPKWKVMLYEILTFECVLE